MQVTEKSFQNILIINFGQMGDVILSLPALEAVRLRFPESRITVATGKPAERIVKAAGVADEQIVVDRVAMRDGNKARSIADITKLIRDVRRRRFDLIVDLHSLPETNLLAFVSGTKSRLLANRESRSIDSLGKFPSRPPKEDKEKHLTERYFDVLLPLGISEVKREYNLKSDPEIESRITERFSEQKITEKSLIGFAIGAGNESRRWSLENFAAVADNFLRERGLIPVVFLGPEETGLASEVVEKFPHETVVFDDLSLLELAAASARMSVFLSNDSGPAHIAGLAQAPVVIVMDERAPLTYLPLGRDVSFVNTARLDMIGTDVVIDAVSSALNRRSGL